eukprot:Em0022g180a
MCWPPVGKECKQSGSPTGVGDWWNQSGLASRLSEQEYLARKKQKLQRRLADHLRLSAQSGQVRGVFGQATDLEQLLKTFTGAASWSHAQLEGLELNTKKYSTTMQRIAELQGQYEAKNKDDEEAYQLRRKDL